MIENKNKRKKLYNKEKLASPRVEHGPSSRKVGS